MVATDKMDAASMHAAEYVAHTDPELIQIEPATYLTIDGTGKWGGEEFTHKLHALRRVVFTVKMARKQAGYDFMVGSLEALWREAPGPKKLAVTNDTDCSWTLLIRVPGYVGPRDVADAVGTLQERGKGADAGEVEVKSLHEGLCVQALHVGPHGTEQETIQRMMAVAAENHKTLLGPQHEIYLSDPLNTDPDRLRSIVRYPLS